jgi:hypothetical protein
MLPDDILPLDTSIPPIHITVNMTDVTIIMALAKNNALILRYFPFIL